MLPPMKFEIKYVETDKLTVTCYKELQDILLYKIYSASPDFIKRIHPLPYYVSYQFSNGKNNDIQFQLYKQSVIKLFCNLIIF